MLVVISLTLLRDLKPDCTLFEPKYTIRAALAWISPNSVQPPSGWGDRGRSRINYYEPYLTNNVDP